MPYIIKGYIVLTKNVGRTAYVFVSTILNVVFATGIMNSSYYFSLLGCIKWFSFRLLGRTIKAVTDISRQNGHIKILVYHYKRWLNTVD